MSCGSIEMERAFLGGTGHPPEHESDACTASLPASSKAAADAAIANHQPLITHLHFG
jgi:hypothetical protein